MKAILIDKNEQGYHAKLDNVDLQQLPQGDVLVKVHYSTLNYKDGLAITGKAPVVRQFPMVPGIDLVGEVEQCDSGAFKVGDSVLLNGWGVGERHWGGLAEKARLSSDWLIPLPKGLSPAQSMMIGTAGYTAMLAIMALEKHGIKPEQGEVLVTGANGGVGSFAIRLLSRLGYQVAASTGRMEESEYLKALGASSIVERQTLSEPNARPLQKERWAGVVDSVGSHTLANACASVQYNGAVAACGLAQGMDFPATVAPFILRNVALLGVDSVIRAKADRLAAWERLAGLLQDSDFELIGREIGLAEVISTAEKLMAGQVRGRVLVRIAE